MGFQELPCGVHKATTAHLSVFLVVRGQIFVDTFVGWRMERHGVEMDETYRNQLPNTMLHGAEMRDNRGSIKTEATHPDAEDGQMGNSAVTIAST